MRGFRAASITVSLHLAFVCGVVAQEHHSLQRECEGLLTATLPELTKYLDGVIPDEKNGDCVTWAIQRMGDERYDPAIAVLARLLDFRRPPTSREKQGIYLRMQTVWEMYPAASALDLIGKQALPAVLRVIEEDLSSSTARENAVAVWMDIYKYQKPEGIALLKQRETEASNEMVKRRLRWAISKAQDWCSPPEKGQCRAAADPKK